MQLNIFEDSRDTGLRNDVIREIERRDGNLARAALVLLEAEYPNDGAAPDLALLVQSLERWTDVPFSTHDVCCDARIDLQSNVEPAARRILSDRDGKSWAAPLWQNLARRASRLPFNPDHEEDHAASLWLRSGDWAEAVEAVRQIESWRRKPAPLTCMALARHRIVGLNGVLYLLAELAWIAPQRITQVANRMANPVLEQLLADFGAHFEGDGLTDDLSWFPAWALAANAHLAPWLGKAERCQWGAPEQAMRIVLELTRIEGKTGHNANAVERREQLRDLNESVFKIYMSTRSPRIDGQGFATGIPRRPTSRTVADRSGSPT